jgi:hypothetical protein
MNKRVLLLVSTLLVVLDGCAWRAPGPRRAGVDLHVVLEGGPRAGRSPNLS